jgi:small subunit ribosomal protein S15
MNGSRTLKLTFVATTAMIQVLLVALTLASTSAFVPARAVSPTSLRMAESESPLPSLDSFLKTPVVTKRTDSDSPLVDRALDSALDFLQDGVVGGEEEEEDELDMFEVYEESPDLEIPYELIAELEEKEATALATKRPSASSMNKVVIDAAIARWRKHDGDCGSAEVQIAICNEIIKYLTKHLLANKWDTSAKRGLQNLVQTRKKFLNYLFYNDSAKADLMVKELGIRFRPPGQLWDKEAKYGSYKNTKSKWMRLRQLARQERDAIAKSKKPVSA